MPNVVLKEGVNWVGVVDWNLRDFHGYVTQPRKQLQRVPNQR